MFRPYNHNMADKVQIVIEVDGRSGTAAIQQVKSGLSGLGPSAASAGQAASAGLKQINSGLSSMSQQLSTLATSVAGALAFRQLTSFMSGTIAASNQLRVSQQGLGAVAKNLGVDINAAKTASQSLTKDGFLNLSDSSKGLQNLLASGLNLGFATELMNKNKDAAIFNRQSHLGLSESIKVFTDGFKNEISTLTDATGVSTNYSRALTDTFKLIKAGQLDFSQYRNVLSESEIATVKHAVASVKAGEQLDKKNKSIVAGIGFLRELQLFEGNAAQGAEDLTVKQNQLESQILETEAAIGTALTPAYKQMLDAALPLLKTVGDWVALHPDLTVGILGTATAVGVLAAALGALAFALPSVLQGLSLLRGLGGLGAGGALAGRLLGGAGVAGLSIGAFSVAQAKLNEEQAINDALGKELSGGKAGADLARKIGLSDTEIAAIRSASKDVADFNAKIQQVATTRAGLAGGSLPLEVTAAAAAAKSPLASIPGLGGGTKKASEGVDLLSGRFLNPLRFTELMGKPGTAAGEDKRFSEQFKAWEQQQQEMQKVQEEIEKAGYDTRLSLITSEAERRSLENERRAREATATIDDLTERERLYNELKSAFDAKSAAELAARNRDRALSLQDEITLLRAEVGGGVGGGAGARFNRQLGRLGAQQVIDLERAKREGASPEVLALLAERQHLEVIKLQQDRYTDLYNNVADHAGRVWDGMFQKGKNVFTALGDTIKGIWATTMRKLFTDFVAGLLTPMFSRLSGVFSGGGAGVPAPAGGGGGLGGIFGGLFGGGGGGGGGFSLGGLFGGGPGGTPPFLPGGSASPLGQGGGLLGKLGGLFGGGAPGGGGGGLLGGLGGLFGGAGSLASGGAPLASAGLGGVLPGGIMAGFGGGLGGTAGGTAAAAGGGAGGSLGIGTLLAKAGGFLVTNPIGWAILAGIGIFAAIKLRKNRQDKFREEILRDFALNVPDKKLLGQIKQIGESAFGRDADKKRFETLRLDPVQSLLLNYAQMTGQSPAQLPIYQKFYGRGLAPQSLSFDPSRGLPAFGEGGVVTRPTIALVGERGPEAIVPLGKGGAGMAYSPTINVDARGATNPAEVARQVKAAVLQVIREERREITRQVERTFQGDYRRKNILDGLIGN